MQIVRRNLLFCLSFLIFSNVLLADSADVYVVDMQKVIADSKLGKSAQQKIQKQADEAQAALTGDSQKLKVLEDKLQKQATLLSEDALMEKRLELNSQRKDLARRGEDMRAELQSLNRKYITSIVEEVRSVLAEISKEKGYDFILEKDERLVVYADKDIDVSDEVIARLDSKRRSL